MNGYTAQAVVLSTRLYYMNISQPVHPAIQNDFLKDWQGFLHTDGYKGYHNLIGVKIIGCFAHARRKFDEALKGMPVEGRRGSSAAKGLEFCNRLFELEREYAELKPDERYEKRLEKASRLRKNS